MIKISARLLKNLVAFIFLVLAGCFCLLHAENLQNSSTRNLVPPLPIDLFSPSQVRTIDGNLIPAENFFSATRCAKCHADTYHSWSESLHRNAAREPFYRESADILLRTRGIEFTRHCESCHTPIALLSGMLNTHSGKTGAPFTELDDEGVTCVVCHSITEARLDGTGSFTIRRPALLAKEDGTPVFGDLTDAQIMSDIPGHKRAMMRPLLRQPEFCATCHKVTAPPELNGYKQIPGFSAYDEWQQSGASQEVITPFYSREVRLDCRACHMPKVVSMNDRAAKQGVIASHRWLGANTVVPQLYGYTEQETLTKQFLQDHKLSVDIFALERKVNGERISLPKNSIGGLINLEAKPGEEVIAEVVVANRNIAHSFPPEVRDLYEAWVEFEVLDENGKLLFHSGYVKADGMLDERAHVYKTVLLDEQSRPITRHQIWLTRAKGYDNSIPAGKADLVHYRFQIPQKSNITLRAKVNYRRLNQEYVNYVLSRQNCVLTLPIVTMASASIKCNFVSSNNNENFPDTTINIEAARRWNDYGIALIEQGQFGSAATAFQQAIKSNPQDPNLLVNAALAEFRTERFAFERVQQFRALELLEQACKLDPKLARARFYRALVWRANGRWNDAEKELFSLANQYPRDREVQRQFGQTLFTLGKFEDARKAFEAILSVDPNDPNAHQSLIPLYASENNQRASQQALNSYLQFREDPFADSVAAKFYEANPRWQEVRRRVHTYTLVSPERPVLTGKAAAPVK